MTTAEPMKGVTGGIKNKEEEKKKAIRIIRFSLYSLIIMPPHCVARAERIEAEAMHKT